MTIRHTRTGYTPVLEPFRWPNGTTSQSHWITGSIAMESWNRSVFHPFTSWKPPINKRFPQIVSSTWDVKFDPSPAVSRRAVRWVSLGIVGEITSRWGNLEAHRHYFRNKTWKSGQNVVSQCISWVFHFTIRHIPMFFPPNSPHWTRRVQLGQRTTAVSPSRNSTEEPGARPHACFRRVSDTKELLYRSGLQLFHQDSWIEHIEPTYELPSTSFTCE